MDDVGGVNVMVDWKYTYKRRGWNIQITAASIQPKTYEAFKEWHTNKGMTCPTEEEYKAALPVEKQKPKIPRKRKTRTKRERH